MSGRDAENRQRPLSHFCDAPATHGVGRRQGGSALRSRRHLRKEDSPFLSDRSYTQYSPQESVALTRSAWETLVANPVTKTDTGKSGFRSNRHGSCVLRAAWRNWIRPLVRVFQRHKQKQNMNFKVINTCQLRICQDYAHEHRSSLEVLSCL